MSEAEPEITDYIGGVDAAWYRGREITEEARSRFRETALASRKAKLLAEAGAHDPQHPIYVPAFAPEDRMPEVATHGLSALSLFSGGGGMDLAFDRSGFQHVASYDTLEAAGATLKGNRPDWRVFAGSEGDVRAIDWAAYRGGVDVLHGGFPCQPFSTAGRQGGEEDARNLLPEFVRSVKAASPRAFVGENVSALAGPKFADYLRSSFYEPLDGRYHVRQFTLSAHEFGVPQTRRRVFFVGFRNKRDAARFVPPEPTHHRPDEPESGLDPAPGVRAALGLPDIGYDALAPTIRSTLTGPRHTTSILSSASAAKAWARLEVWPSGVAASREAARAFPAKDGHFRLSVDDCALLQGFPSAWRFTGAVYMALGQIGNSVAPPVAYEVSLAVARALHGREWSPG